MEPDGSPPAARSPVPHRQPGSPRAPQADRRDARPRPRLPPGPLPLTSDSDSDMTDVDEEYRERSPYWQPFPMEVAPSPEREPMQESQALFEDDSMQRSPSPPFARNNDSPAAPAANRRDVRGRPQRRTLRRVSTSSESSEEKGPAVVRQSLAPWEVSREHVSETPEPGEDSGDYSDAGSNSPPSEDEEPPLSPQVILSSQPLSESNDEATLALLDAWESPSKLGRARQFLSRVRDSTWDSISRPGDIILSAYIPQRVETAVAMRSTPTLGARVWGASKLVVATTQGTRGRRDFANLKNVLGALENIRPLMPTFLFPLLHMQAAGFSEELAHSQTVSRRGLPVDWMLFEDLSGVCPYLNPNVVERNAPNNMMTFLQYVDDERTSPTDVLLCILQVLCALEAAQRCVAYVNWRFSVNSVGMRDFTRMRDHANLDYYVSESHLLRMCPNAIPVIVRHAHARLELSSHDESIWSVDVENFVKSLYSSTTRHASLLLPLEEHLKDLTAQGQSARPADIIAWVLGHYHHLEEDGDCVLIDVNATEWDRRPSSVVVLRERMS